MILQNKNTKAEIHITHAEAWNRRTQEKGFWYTIEKGEKGYSAGDFKCSVCGMPNATYKTKPNFCPNCGADMRGEQNDS